MKRAAERRLAERKAERLLGVPKAVDHREATVQELYARYATVSWLRDEVACLPSLTTQTERGESPHVLMALLDKHEKRLNEILRLCHDMRIDQQMVDIARAHADQTDRLIHALLRQLGLDPQDVEVRQAVRASLTLVEGGAT